MKILVPDGSPWEQLKTMRCFESEHRVYIVSRDPEPLSKYSKRCASFYFCKERTESARLQFLLNVVEREEIDIIFPCSEEGTGFVIRNAGALTDHCSVIELPTLENFENTIDKLRFATACDSLGITVPQTHSGTCLSHADFARRKTILKPRISNGGHGILLIRSKSDLRKVTESSRDLTQYVAQPYLEGTDYCVTAYCYKGEMLAHTTQKDVSNYQKGYFGPQRIMRFFENRELIVIAKEALQRLQWNGIACMDFRFNGDEKQYYLLEINPRIGQAVIGCKYAGVNFPEIMIRRPTEMQSYESRDIIFSHPRAYFSSLIARGMNSGSPYPKLKHSSAKEAFQDPLPEAIVLIRKVFGKN